MLAPPHPDMRFRLFALLCAFALPAVAQTTFVNPAKPGSPEAATVGSLEIARTGKEVLLTWTLPEGEIRMIEIMRHTSPQAPGRGRVAGVRPEPPIFADTVPDEQAIYWYWLKITRPNGLVLNIGPVPTPESSVWTP